MDCVRNNNKSSELNTHIKIDLLKKKLDGVKCTCEDFKECFKDRVFIYV